MEAYPEFLLRILEGRSRNILRLIYLRKGVLIYLVYHTCLKLLWEVGVELCDEYWQMVLEEGLVSRIFFIFYFKLLIKDHVFSEKC